MQEVDHFSKGTDFNYRQTDPRIHFTFNSRHDHSLWASRHINWGGRAALIESLIKVIVSVFEYDQHDGPTWSQPHNFGYETFVEGGKALFTRHHRYRSKGGLVFDLSGNRLGTLKGSF